VPATAVRLSWKWEVASGRITLGSEHGGLARGATSARGTDHGRDIHGGPTKGCVSTGASGYSDCHIVIFNGMIYMFEAAGKPHQE
jgi:hypothetical protein